MVKEELLTLLNDEEVRRKIVEIVRFGVKSPASKSARLAAMKIDLMFLLCDGDIREEILKIVQSDEKISASPVKTPVKPKTSAKSTPQTEKQTAEKPKQITSTGADTDIMALRNKIRSRLTNKPAAEPPPVVEDEKVDEPSDLKFTYISEKTCPICEEKTRIVQCKTRLVADTLDIDFCMHYKNFNPYLYTIWVCEKCGYAADETRFQDRYADKVRKGVRKFLSENDMRTPFVETRTAEEALAFYESAIFFNETFEMSKGRQGGLYQKMAWICRIEGDVEREKEYLLKAAELYEVSLDSERYPIGKVSDTAATYIVAVNYFMLKEYDKASYYLNQIVGNPNLRSTAPKIHEKARHIWQDIRAMKIKK